MILESNSHISLFGPKWLSITVVTRKVVVSLVIQKADKLGNKLLQETWLGSLAGEMGTRFFLLQHTLHQIPWAS